MTFLRPVTIVSLKPVQAGWCSSHRYSALAAWSPLARQNGSLPAASNNIPKGLRKLEWVNYFEEHGYEKLMRALCERANKLGLVLVSGLLPVERERHLVAAADSVADSALYPDTERHAVNGSAAYEPGVRDFVARQPLPDKLARLRELAYTLFWSREPGATDAFRRLDPKLWNKCGHNPVALLAQISPDSLQRAAESLSRCKGRACT